jgi:S-adenosylmethionine:tRNA ribosyltransferase-isomerase
LASLLRPGDVLVRNTSRVLPARLAASKEPSGARCEILLVEPAGDGSWWALVRPGRRLPTGTLLRLADGTRIEIVDVDAEGARRVRPHQGGDLLQSARACGSMPLPPYVRRPADGGDARDYQTVYANEDGSVAAPTAGLHFSAALLEDIAASGVDILDLVLHVGPGTFQPIRSPDPRRHEMHAERFAVPLAVLEKCDAARRRGGRVVAVGTTVVRALESVAEWERGGAAVTAEIAGDRVRGRTRLFIHPPYAFGRVDALVTNFHLPRSSLLLLVDAFAARETVRAAYAHAVSAGFRFFSYGDAMWIE